MRQLTWLAWTAVVGVGAAVAVAVFLVLQAWSHLLTDDAALHQQLIPLLNYNLQQGRLLPMPGPTPPPAPTPAPEPPKP
jgi:hypothetical protein